MDFEPRGSSGWRLNRFRLPTQGGHAQRQLQDASHAVSIGSKITRYRVNLIIASAS